MSAQPIDFLATHVLMIRPGWFHRDDLAAQTNSFMHKPDRPEDQIARAAASEFDGLVNALTDAGVHITLIEDNTNLPDSVFPNNWFSWHQLPGGPSVVVVTYPMCSPARRTERDLVDFTAVASARGLHVERQIHMEAHEHDDRFLEGTGSLVPDRSGRVVYAAASPRTDATLVREWAETLRYRPVLFDAVDNAGDPIYHTNVMLALGHGFALLGASTIPNEAERHAVICSIEDGGREVIELSAAQIGEMAGNALQLRSTAGDPVLAMSARALASLSAHHVARIERHTSIVAAPVPTIERIGGGSVRCMLAEIGTAPAPQE